jgi:ribosomal protein S18 acetylase RimI-like enzyme
MAKMTRMRPVVISDIPYLYEICLKTAASGKDASALYYDPYLVGQYYAAPYVFYCPSLCFVVELNDAALRCPMEPAGYIVCAADTADFNRWMEAEWLPALRRRYCLPYAQEKIRSPLEANLIAAIHKNLSCETSPELADYPAHFHIDLLPSIQGAGWGRKLIETLLAALQERNVPGVHLGVSASNTGAIAFYQKMGFSVLQEADWGFVLGQRLAL